MAENSFKSQDATSQFNTEQVSKRSSLELPWTTRDLAKAIVGIFKNKTQAGQSTMLEEVPEDGDMRGYARKLDTQLHAQEISDGISPDLGYPTSSVHTEGRPTTDTSNEALPLQPQLGIHWSIWGEALYEAEAIQDESPMRLYEHLHALHYTGGLQIDEERCEHNYSSTRKFIEEIKKRNVLHYIFPPELEGKSFPMVSDILDTHLTNYT